MDSITMSCSRCETALTGGVDTFGPAGAPLCSVCYLDPQRPEPKKTDLGDPTEGKKLYEVRIDVEISHTFEVCVWANSEDEATKIASVDYDTREAGRVAADDGFVDLTITCLEEVLTR